MARQHEKTDPRPTKDSVEAAIVRRRRILQKAALLGVPMILTLHGRASAQGGGTGGMTGNVTQPP